MWTRRLLKENARRALRGRYWPCLAACLAAAFLGGNQLIASAVAAPWSLTQWLEQARQPNVWTGNAPGEMDYALYLMLEWGLLPVFALTLLAGLAAAVLFRALVSAPARVGLCRYLMENRQGRSPLGTLFTVFRTPYFSVVKACFLTELKIAAGYLLFLVPGVVWSYRYRMVPYLLAENPNLSARRAMVLSRQMMHSEKWYAFVLDLSFLGWRILCAATMGVGFLFLQPYWEATGAELYAALRSKAFAFGLSDAGELSGFVRHGAGTSPSCGSES